MFIVTANFHGESFAFCVVLLNCGLMFRKDLFMALGSGPGKGYVFYLFLPGTLKDITCLE